MVGISGYWRNEARANPRACVAGRETDQISMNMPLRPGGVAKTISAAVAPSE